MRLSRFKISGFRGKYEVDVPLSEAVNYIIGRNGTGKTTLVKMLYASLAMRVGELSRVPFNSIEISFTSQINQSSNASAQLTYSRPEQTGDQSPDSPFLITLKRDGEETIISDSTLLARRRIGQLRRARADDQSLLSFVMPVDDPSSLTPNRLEEARNRLDAAVRIREYITSNVQTRWLPIERYNRAASSEDDTAKSPIELKVDELQNQLVRYLSEIDKLAASEFEKFRNNALLSLFKVETTQRNSRTIAKGDIDRLASDLEILIPELKLDKDSEQDFRESSRVLLDMLRSRAQGRPLEALRQATARLNEVVSLWRDSQSRVSKLFERRDGFLSALDGAFALSDIKEENRAKFAKTPYLESNNELSFRQGSSDKDVTLKLSDLSSGEKQFFILLAEVLLERNQETVLIIDEPELSLHITWQAALVADLKSLNPNAQLVLATHSPDIVQPGIRNIIQMEDVVS